MFRRVSKTQLWSILKRMNLNSFQSKRENVHIAKFTDVLSSLGNQTLKLLVIRYKMTSADKTIVFHLRYIDFTVFKTNEYCNPKIKYNSCENSQTPRDVSLSDFSVFKPIVERSCGQESNLTYDWSIDHYVQHKTMNNLLEENKSFLRLAQYELEFNDEDDTFSGFYTIKLSVFEQNHRDLKHGMAVWKVKFHFNFSIICFINFSAQCFVSVTVKEPKAVIKGGEVRKVFSDQKFILDARESIDEGTKSNDQPLSFWWNCSSSADFCKSFKSSRKLKASKTQFFLNI